MENFKIELKNAVNSEFVAVSSGLDKETNSIIHLYEYDLIKARHKTKKKLIENLQNLNIVKFEYNENRGNTHFAFWHTRYYHQVINIENYKTIDFFADTKIAQSFTEKIFGKLHARSNHNKYLTYESVIGAYKHFIKFGFLPKNKEMYNYIKK